MEICQLFKFWINLSNRDFLSTKYGCTSVYDICVTNALFNANKEVEI